MPTKLGGLHYTVQRNSNPDTGCSYEIRHITKAPKGRPDDLYKYRVILKEWRDVIGSALFAELHDAKVYAFNHMAYKGDDNGNT
jgi:hypothetical protein